MSLTNSQFNILKAAIIADPVAGPLRTAGDAYSLLAWCNAPSAVSAWRPAVTADEIYAAHKINDYIARSGTDATAERMAFDSMTRVGRIHNFTISAVRAGVANIFSSTGGAANSSRTAIFAAAQEFATNAQAAIGGTQQSVGNTSQMGETVTALKRSFGDLVRDSEVNRLIV